MRKPTVKEGSESQYLNLEVPVDSPRENWTTHESSILDELEFSNYDLTTLHFYFKRKLYEQR